MSDLISRSALLQKFNDTGIQITFDLSVEEILGEDVDIDDFTMLVQDAIQAYKNMIIGTIKDIPTAYDVSKVVAELEDLQCVNPFLTTTEYEHKAIEIARKGGVE